MNIIEELKRAGLSGNLGKNNGKSDHIEIWVRDGFKCIYCDADLLSHPSLYFSAQLDHILPKNKYVFLSTIKENLVLACACCNSQLKHTFDPAKNINTTIESLEDFLSNRQNLLKESRRHVNDCMDKIKDSLEKVKQIKSQNIVNSFF